MSKKRTTIANFNCTFGESDNSRPLLEYFEKIFYPAITQSDKCRVTNNKEYYLTNVKIIRLQDDQIALVGEHVKRVNLNIKQDFNPKVGYIEKNQRINSAPISKFVLLLRNHRIIYYCDQEGSPDIRSFATTIRHLVNVYRMELYKRKIDELKISDLAYSENKLSNISQFSKIFNTEYPKATIDVVPIPSESLVESKFNDIKSIQSLQIKLYNLNAEIDDEPLFRDFKKSMRDIKSKNTNIFFLSPKEKSEVKRYATKCQGKYDYIIKARTDTNESLTLKPDSMAEQINLEVNEDMTIDQNADLVYMQVKDNPILKECSEDNIKIYEECLSRLHELLV